jgi:hypothetical protein
MGLNQALPDDIKEFIHTYISSIGHLELLIFLFNNQEKEWSISQLAHELRTNETFVRQQVASLSSFVKLSRDTSECFKFSDSDSELIKTISKLASLYQSHRYTVTDEVYIQKKDPFRIFVDAFKFRKK